MFKRYWDRLRLQLPDQAANKTAGWIVSGVGGLGAAGYYYRDEFLKNFNPPPPSPAAPPIPPPTGVIQLDAFKTGRPVSSNFDAKHTYPTLGFDKVGYKDPRGQDEWQKWKNTLASCQAKVLGEKALLVEGDAPLGLYWLLGRTLERYEGRICVRQASPQGKCEDICFANAPARHVASGPAVLSGKPADRPSGSKPTTLFLAVNTASPWTDAQKKQLDSSLPARKSSLTLYVEPRDGHAIPVSQDNIDNLRANVAHLAEETLKTKCQTCDKVVIALFGPKTLALAMGATLDYAQIKSGQVFLDWKAGSNSYDPVTHD